MPYVRDSFWRGREFTSLQQMQAACAALDRVWGIGPGQTSEVQPPLLRALGHGGNYLVGAYGPDGALVGASVGFFTEPLGAAMHSHITGVLPGVAGAGVGAAMKWHQRQWALERGLTRITWTYDPLIARNSFFNLTRLGARPETYFVDFYGVMHDGANRGQPTDRMQVGWDLSAVSTLDAQRVVLERRPTSEGPDPDRAIRTGAATLLSVGPAGEPVSGEPVAGKHRRGGHRDPRRHRSAAPRPGRSRARLALRVASDAGPGDGRQGMADHRIRPVRLVSAGANSR